MDKASHPRHLCGLYSRKISGHSAGCRCFAMGSQMLHSWSAAAKGLHSCEHLNGHTQQAHLHQCLHLCSQQLDALQVQGLLAT